MEINDLMIGDWVNTNKGIGTVTMVSNNMAICVLLVSDSTEKCFTNDEIKTIPLTTEILERNQFVKGIQKFWRTNKTEDHTLMFDVDIDYKGHTETFTNEIIVSRNPDNNLFDIGFTNGSMIFNIEYVHQLQHALRLCGINKEIVL